MYSGLFFATLWRSPLDKQTGARYGRTPMQIVFVFFSQCECRSPGPRAEHQALFFKQKKNIKGNTELDTPT